MKLLAWMLILSSTLAQAQRVTELEAIDVTPDPASRGRKFRPLDEGEISHLLEAEPDRPAVPAAKEPLKASKTDLFKRAAEEFAQGKYKSVVAELKIIEERIAAERSTNKAVLGLLAYWRGMAFNRLQDFPNAITEFERSLGLSYAPVDIHYEYGQALFAAEKLQEARLQFRESVKKRFKRAVSLYYIAYSSKELGEKKKAVTFYKAIEKLPPAESAEVRQAAEAQIADIYLEQAEHHPDVFRVIESYVIPQYEKAFAVDESSSLAEAIKEKITKLQRKYDIIMFHLVNGRPTLQPPHFLRVSQETGLDTNVTFNPQETTVSKSLQESWFSKTDLIGRYTFYYKNYLSISPELRVNYTRYLKREPEIFRNDNVLLAPALRTTFEHTLWGKPASVLLDYDFNEARRDINARNELDFSSRSHVFMLGERFNFFSFGETILRFRYRLFDSYSDSSDSKTMSLVLEQMVPAGENTFLFFSSYDRTRVEDGQYHTNALSLRGDFILSRVRDWFTPSVGLGLTLTDPIIARSRRGLETLFNPNARVSKTVGKNWRGSLKYDFMQNRSKDEANFAFKKSMYSFELEYLF